MEWLDFKTQHNCFFYYFAKLFGIHEQVRMEKYTILLCNYSNPVIYCITLEAWPNMFVIISININNIRVHDDFPHKIIMFDHNNIKSKNCKIVFVTQNENSY